MSVGIEAMYLYAGRHALEIGTLARARGADRQYVSERLMCERRSVYPAWEDGVTLAVNAAKGLLRDRQQTRQDIGLVLVGTESAVDYGKPIATWVHRYCELPENCCCLEVKHACYGATGALMLALRWVESTGRRALVVSSDSSRYHVGDAAELICGGCSVAMLIGPMPDLLEVHPDCSGYWTTEVADTFRPTPDGEVGDNQLSLYAYLDALEGAYSDFQTRTGHRRFPDEFEGHIYHAPFPGMALQAHTALMGQTVGPDKARVRESFERKVLPGLRFGMQIGSAYGSSTFVSLMSLLSCRTDLAAGDSISIFAYGSGCQGEFYRAVVGAGAANQMAMQGVDRALAARLPLTVDAYEALESERRGVQRAEDYRADRDSIHFREAYRGSGLLVLERIQDFQRSYLWA